MVNRKSPRRFGFDYSSARIYFVTINCHEGHNLFGKILNDGSSNQLILSGIGIIATEKIDELSSHHSGVEVLDYVVMPNHVHLLISLQNQGKSSSLSTIVGSYKSGVSRVARQTFPDLELWQKSFSDHVIRDDKDLLIHSEYIKANVERWRKDKYFIEG
jgi:REP element-mobilizing transposase RayT